MKSSRQTVVAYVIVGVIILFLVVVYVDPNVRTALLSSKTVEAKESVEIETPMFQYNEISDYDEDYKEEEEEDHLPSNSVLSVDDDENNKDEDTEYHSDYEKEDSDGEDKYYYEEEQPSEEAVEDMEMEDSEYGEDKEAEYYYEEEQPNTPTEESVEDMEMGFFLEDSDEEDEDYGDNEEDEFALKDINARGMWQMQQVEDYCKRNKLEDLKYTLPVRTVERQKLFRHLLVDNKRKLIFCFIPKVGCTNMRWFMFILNGAISEDSITYWDAAPENSILERAIRQTSFLQQTLTDEERLEMVTSYWKFTFLRNPLERLVSAFRNKLESPLDISAIYSEPFNKIKCLIFERYHPEELQKWLASNGSYQLRLDFQTFIEWVVDMPNELLNEHFSPMIVNAQPCRIRYNFYGNFNDFSLEMELVMKKLGVPREYFHDASYYRPGEDTVTMVDQYYSTVSDELKAALFTDFYSELDFYYTLFPQEKESHVSLLGVTELIEH